MPSPTCLKCGCPLQVHCPETPGRPCEPGYSAGTTLSETFDAETDIMEMMAEKRKNGLDHSEIAAQLRER